MSEQQHEEQSTLKCFGGGKSKAMKGLRRYLHGKGDFTDEQLAAMLFQHGENGKWCFDAESVDATLALVQEEAPKPTEGAANEEGSEQEQAPETQEEPSSDEGAAPAPAVFGAMNHQLSNVPHAPAPQPAQRAQSRSSYTIEKNRPEQHGIKRPSAGGLCRAVWDAMDELRDQQNGVIPVSAQVRVLAEQKGWNKNNAMLEFYQWRKFNGIVGRTPKQAPAAPEAQPQAPAPAPTEPSNGESGTSEPYVEMQSA